MKYFYKGTVKRNMHYLIPMYSILITLQGDSHNKTATHRLPQSFNWPKDPHAIRNIQIGVYKFNRKPRKGIEYLVSKGLLKESPQSVGIY